MRDNMLTWGSRGAFGICVVVVSLVLPAANSSQCGSNCKHVIIDPDLPNTIAYKVSEEATAGLSCDCSGFDSKMFITSAYLYSASDNPGGVHNLSIQHRLSFNHDNNNNNNPHARIPIGETTQPETKHFIGEALPGLYKYGVGYNYGCLEYDISIHPTECNGKSKEMELTVEIVDYMLKLASPVSNQPAVIDRDKAEMDGSSSVITYTVEKTGSNVSLICSSGLKPGADNESSLSVPALFMFWKDSPELQSNTNYTQSIECRTSLLGNVTNTSWIVGRQASPPYDCVLTILDFGPENVGRYSCAGILAAEANIPPEIDRSKLTIDLKTAEKPVSYLIYIIVGVVVTIAIVVILLIYLVKRAKIKPGTTGLSHHSLHQSYGSTSLTSNTSTDAHRLLITRRETDTNIDIDPPFRPQSQPSFSTPSNLPSPPLIRSLSTPLLPHLSEEQKHKIINPLPRQLTPGTRSSSDEEPKLKSGGSTLSAASAAVREGTGYYKAQYPKKEAESNRADGDEKRSDHSSDDDSPKSSKRSSSDQESNSGSSISATAAAIEEGTDLYNVHYPKKDAESAGVDSESTSGSSSGKSSPVQPGAQETEQ